MLATLVLGVNLPHGAPPSQQQQQHQPVRPGVPPQGLSSPIFFTSNYKFFDPGPVMGRYRSELSKKLCHTFNCLLLPNITSRGLESTSFYSSGVRMPPGPPPGVPPQGMQQQQHQGGIRPLMPKPLGVLSAKPQVSG